jgi:hypothetical protein
MRCRLFTAVPVVLTGVFVASAVFAAGADISAVQTAALALAPSETATLSEVLPANFALSGVTVLPAGEAAPASNLSADTNRGVQIDLSRARNWNANGDLFAPASTLNSRYMTGASAFAGAAFALGDDVTFQFNHTNLDIGPLGISQPGTFSRDLAQRLGAGVDLMGTTSANLSWNFSDWGGLAIMASRSSGNASLLGPIRTGVGAAGFADSAALGISARVGFGEGWVTTIAYSEGVTQLDLNNSQLIGSFDPVRSQAYALGVAKQGLFGSDALGIAVSRPLQIFGPGNIGAMNSNLGFASQQARESDVELGYVTTFLDGSIALQANAAYQLNPAGAKGQTAGTGVARAKVNF